MEHHDISTGLRENWSARRKWKMAISGVQAAIRMGRAAHSGDGSASSSRRVSLEQQRPPAGGTANTRSSDEYDTATENEAGDVTDLGLSMTRKRSTNLMQKQTSDQTAKRISTELRQDLDGKMAQLERKTEDFKLSNGGRG